MNAARVRIGRVRPKSGGELYLLPTPSGAAADNRCSRELRVWAREVLNYDVQPDVIACVSWIYDPQGGYWSACTAFISDHPAIPVDMLPSLAEQTLRRHLIEKSAERLVMHRLGYVPHDTPDGAA